MQNAETETLGSIKVVARSIASRLKHGIAIRFAPILPLETGALAAIDDAKIEGCFRDSVIEEAFTAFEAQVQELGLPGLPGAVNAGDRRALFYLINAFKIRRILEIGTHSGLSTLYFAGALRACWQQKTDDIGVTTVDIRDVNSAATSPWTKLGFPCSPAQMLSKTGTQGWVEFVVQDSRVFLQTDTRRFDFVFVDGDHSARGAYVDIVRSARKLSGHGALVLHDYYPEGRQLWRNQVALPGVWLATQKIIRENPKVRVLPLGDLPWPTKLCTNKTSLAILGTK